MSKMNMSGLDAVVRTGPRDFVPGEILRQIGIRTIAAISGGKWALLKDGVELPCGSGYRVRVRLAADDTYTVQRVMVRAGKEFAKGERTQVYFDQVGEVAYYASCYRSYEPGEWEAKA